MGQTIRVGTRGSRLALTQTELVAAALRLQAPDADVQTVVISSLGDQHADAPLASLGVGVFTKALEEALLDKRIDLAVPGPDVDGAITTNGRGGIHNISCFEFP